MMAGETSDGAVGRLSSRIESRPRDLLLRFGGSACAEEPPAPAAAGGELVEEVELSLGLSLGGCSCGAEPKGKKQLVRSSSAASLLPSPSDDGNPPLPAAAPLTSTSSLPTEAGEERRKRKEVQSLKRMEAKRKRLERRNSIRPGAGVAAAAKEQPEEDMDSQFPGGGQFVGKVNGATPSGRRQGWAAMLVRGASLPVDGFPHIFPGAMAPQGSSSSGMPGLESCPAQAAGISRISSCTEAKSSSTSPSFVEHTDRDKAVTAPLNSAGGASPSCRGGEPNPLKRKMAAGRAHSMGEVERNIMEEMPCVSAQGGGPGGRRVEGFLYKYRKGEEVRIVCFCHGRFLTPAEFVRHAGGGDVPNPLRHIVVSPSPPAFL